MKIKQLGEQTSLAKYNVDKDPIEFIFGNRGIEDLSDFFEHSWEECVSPASALDNILLAADRVLWHLDNSETIAVLVDCDCDGYMSAATIVNYLKKAKELLPERWAIEFPEIVFLHHSTKKHGLDDTKVMQEVRDKVKPQLLIIPDASGTAEQYKALNNLDIDIVVLDHHSTEEHGDNKKTIVVNNQHSKSYPNKALSGVGVTWQLCRVLDRILNIEVANIYLDLVAVGLVADVMSLKSKETRFLVKEGLSQINNPFLQQCLLMNDFKLKGSLTPVKVAFNIAPLINAVTRIGSFEEKDLLFKALLDDAHIEMVPSGNRNSRGQLVPIVAEAYRLITNAKARQVRRRDKFVESIDAIIKEEKILEDKIILVTIPKGDYEEEHRSLSGLVCNEMIDVYHRPVLILFETEPGLFTGSVRSPENIEVFEDFRSQCQESQLCKFASGHPSAFGTSMTKENIPLFRNFFNIKFSDVDTSPVYYCDFILDTIEMDESEVADIFYSISNFEGTWGHGLEEPLIAFKNVPIRAGSMTLVGQQKGRPTLRIQVGGVTLIKFNSSPEEFDALSPPYSDSGPRQYYEINVVGRASINEFRGNVTPQLMIEDYSIASVEYDF